MGYRMPHYLEGPGKIGEPGAFLKEKKINDVLVVTGSGMVRRGQVQPLLDGFAANGISYTLQTYDTTDPTTDDVELGYQTYQTKGCKAIVAIGGGSRIDCAKGIAAKAVHPRKKVSQLQGLFRLLWPFPPQPAPEWTRWHMPWKPIPTKPTTPSRKINWQKKKPPPSILSLSYGNAKSSDN